MSRSSKGAICQWLAWIKERIVIDNDPRGIEGRIADPVRDVVVVVPAHNEQDRLPACLESLAVAAKRVPVPVTVIVVLDACTDDSHEVISGSVRTLRIAARNVGAARSAGFAGVGATSGEQTWCATTDADSVVPVTWLEGHLRHHRQGAEAVVGTVCVDWQHHTSATRRTYERLYGLQEGQTSHRHVHGANMGIRADVYWRVGGFQPLPVGEDADLVSRLVQAGARIAWDRTNPVMTSDRLDCRVTGGFGHYVKDLVGQR